MNKFPAEQRNNKWFFFSLKLCGPVTELEFGMCSSRYYLRISIITIISSDKTESFMANVYIKPTKKLLILFL